MNDSLNLLRYTCQLALPGFGVEGQLKLQNAKVLVAGAGGLGCPAAQYLAAAGIGTLGLADYDTVSVSNLHRQVLYTPADAGLKKVHAACSRLSLQNPEITVVPHDLKITSQNVLDLVNGYDIVADCTDNFDTRYLLNDACVLLGKPIVYGAVYQYEGQVAVWNVMNADGIRTPNYRDVFPQVDASQIPDCVTGGVIPTITGIIGCMQAHEIIKYLTGSGELLAGKILVMDGLTLQSRIIKTGKVTATRITALTETEDIPVITAAVLKEQLAKNTYVLVDVRNDPERADYNIGGAHIPMDQMENFAGFYEETGKPVVFYCASGKRSAEAVKKAFKMFPEGSFFSLEGGIKAWRELQPVV